MSLPSILASTAAATRQAANLGFVVQLMLGTERRSFRMAALRAYVWPAIQLDQIAFSFNSQGVPLACVTWAFLTEEVGRELAANPARLIELPEWNEGTDLWIIDVIAPYGHARGLLGALARSRLAGFDQAKGMRRHPDGKLKRLSNVRRRATSMLRRSTVAPVDRASTAGHAHI